MLSPLVSFSLNTITSPPSSAADTFITPLRDSTEITNSNLAQRTIMSLQQGGMAKGLSDQSASSNIASASAASIPTDPNDKNANSNDADNNTGAKRIGDGFAQEENSVADSKRLRVGGGVDESVDGNLTDTNNSNISNLLLRNDHFLQHQHQQQLDLHLQQQQLLALKQQQLQLDQQQQLMLMQQSVQQQQQQQQMDPSTIENILGQRMSWSGANSAVSNNSMGNVDLTANNNNNNSSNNNVNNVMLRAMFPNNPGSGGGSGHGQNVSGNMVLGGQQRNMFLDDPNSSFIMRTADLTAQLHAARSQAATNAALLAASIGNRGVGSNPMVDNIFGQGATSQGATTSGGLNWASLPQSNNSLQQQQQQQTQAQQLVALRSLTDLDTFRQAGNLSTHASAPSALSSLLGGGSGAASSNTNSQAASILRGGSTVGGADRTQDIASFLRQMQSSSAAAAALANFGPSNVSALQQIAGWGNSDGMLRDDNSPFGVSNSGTQGSSSTLVLPPCDEGAIEPFTNRTSFHLGIDEDSNWLSEFHCHVRSELVEIFLASSEDVKARNNSIAYHQVGIRCRFCAHMTPSARAGRSSAFPSSLRQIYQSFTMVSVRNRESLFFGNKH